MSLCGAVRRRYRDFSLLAMRAVDTSTSQLTPLPHPLTARQQQHSAQRPLTCPAHTVVPSCSHRPGPGHLPLPLLRCLVVAGIMAAFKDLHSDAGLKALNGHLASRSYIEGSAAAPAVQPGRALSLLHLFPGCRSRSVCPLCAGAVTATRPAVLTLLCCLRSAQSWTAASTLTCLAG